MLVLSREKDESVCIGSNIEVKVLEVCGGRVRLGLCARRKLNPTAGNQQRPRGAPL